MCWESIKCLIKNLDTLFSDFQFYTFLMRQIIKKNDNFWLVTQTTKSFKEELFYIRKNEGWVEAITL